MIKAIIFCAIFTALCFIIKFLVAAVNTINPKIIDKLLCKPLDFFK